MKKYFVKIGKLYINSIYLKDECVNSNFIYGIDLTVKKDYVLRVTEEEQEKMREILKEVLKLENEYSEIEFEEVTESESK